MKHLQPIYCKKDCAYRVRPSLLRITATISWHSIPAPFFFKVGSFLISCDLITWHFLLEIANCIPLSDPVSSHPISSHLSLSQPFWALRSSCQFISCLLISSLLFSHLVNSSHIFSADLLSSHLTSALLSSLTRSVLQTGNGAKAAKVRFWSRFTSKYRRMMESAKNKKSHQ